ncbi:hypothetical protein HDU98_004013 [Podochytrium sp. JEL0797]|nr:hypothetical protein HDU98_004013 [Podochytrium sp. JEL0797]
MKVHNPLPQELAQEFEKVASILDHFVKGTTQLDQKLIPEKIIHNCKGLAVLTIVKAGFVWSGRAGAGLVVAKLPDGRWSAPSAIAAGGAGFGAQIGAEITDTVLILNTDSAVKAFTHGGNVTFGANMSIAAGPTGRQAEASGSVGNLAPIYSYSKTKGLFAGVSFEGLVIITRKETNARFYNEHVNPVDLLSGKVEPPPEAEVLYRALNSRGFGSKDSGLNNPPVANHPPPTYTPSPASTVIIPPRPTSNSLKRPASNSNVGPSNHPPPPPPKPFTAGGITSTMGPPKAFMIPTQSPIPARPSSINNKQQSTPMGPPPAIPPKPAQHAFHIKTVTAVFDFQGEREGDLSFRVGEHIVVLDETRGDGWWKGEMRTGGVPKQGLFPSNYVK